MHPDEPKPFLDHLEEFRFLLIKSSIVLLIFTILSFFFAAQLIQLLELPLVKVLKQLQLPQQASTILRSLSPTGAFIMALKAAFASSLIFSSPFILFFLIQFIVPALKPNEKKILKPFCFSFGLLFLSGILVAFFFAFPITLYFLWTYHQKLGIQPAWTIENFINFELKFLLGFGIIFELPIVILTLVHLDIVTKDQIVSKRKHAIVFAFVLAAILTPPDPVSQICMALPIIFLYEICIAILKIKKSTH